VRSFETFLLQKIKVDGKLGNLRELVRVSLDGSTVVVHAQEPFSKRYLKYLTKKYLKKNTLRDWLRVVSTGAQGYAIKYFNISDTGAGDDEATDK